jgi:fatty acid desaturase
MTATMVPDRAVLTPAHPDERIREDGRPTPAFREQLRRIPSWRNAASVVSLYAQTVGILAVALAWGHPVGWAIAFLLMGRANAQFASLMHEAAHRLLFANRRLNDLVGRWLLGYPVWTNTDAYRRVHMAHHREEFGPMEPDLALYRGYPITRASFRRKMVRDATGRTGARLLRAQLATLRSGDARARRTLLKILGVQAVVLGLFTVSGHPLAYPVLWLAPYLTVWRVINRLRSIAEHGGMHASADRRETTHTVRQSWPASLALVPYKIGYHLAHHVDSGVPFRNLPRYHRALVAAGYVTPAIEYPTYRALWRALRSG